MIEVIVLGAAVCLFFSLTLKMATFKARRLDAALDYEFEDLESAPEMPGNLTGRGIDPLTGGPR